MNWAVCSVASSSTAWRPTSTRWLASLAVEETDQGAKAAGGRVRVLLSEERARTELEARLAANSFDARAGSVLTLTADESATGRHLVLGLGRVEQLRPEGLRRAAAALAQECARLGPVPELLLDLGELETLRPETQRNASATGADSGSTNDPSASEAARSGSASDPTSTGPASTGSENPAFAASFVASVLEGDRKSVV